jgi:thiol-disulfide isomerase/thioredoxin
MSQKFKRYLKDALTILVVMTITANILSYYRSTDLNTQPLDIDYKFKENKPILLHFWATWCPTCKLEASNIQALSKDYEVLTIAVNSGSNKDIKEYMDENGFDFRFINDYDGLFAQNFNISAYPTTFIYDKNKNLVFSEVGYTSTIGLYLRMRWASF